MSLRGSIPLLRQRGEQTNILQRAYCERIICVHDKYAELGWWHDLERDDELLFAEAGRIVETDLENLRDEVEMAVERGYRPLVFIDGMRSWGLAVDALGSHQAFGSVYVLGRDDEQMSSLLHNPSDELLSVAREGGRIAVPLLEYGKALEEHFNVRLEDFFVTDLKVEDPLLPKLQLVCRLNPFRYIDVKLYCRKGTARLHQKYHIVDIYRDDDESCSLPLPFQEWLLDFAVSNPVNTGEMIDDPSAFMKAFTETFQLPLALQGWEPGGAPPWKVLLQQLDRMSRGIKAHLSAANQELLALVSGETIARALQDPGGLTPYTRPIPTPTRGVSYSDRRDQENTATPDTRAAFVILSYDAEAPKSSESVGAVFDVTWLFKDKPETKPKVILERSSHGSQPISCEWSDDLRLLRLLGVEINNNQIGWTWSADENELRISLINDE